MKYGAVIVAGGMGKRLGKPIPKAFVPLNNKELFIYSLEVLDKCSKFDIIVLVVPESAVESTEEKIKKITKNHISGHFCPFFGQF